MRGTRALDACRSWVSPRHSFMLDWVLAMTCSMHAGRVLCCKQALNQSEPDKESLGRRCCLHDFYECIKLLHNSD